MSTNTIAELDHTEFRRLYACSFYHGDPVYDWPRRELVRSVEVLRYEPDPRCPDLVVWQISGGGATRAPGVRRGWTVDQVKALLAEGEVTS